MKLHLVGGFLGSGKTTAIIGAAKCLMAQGNRVGVVTNDQGKYLVDTAFVRLADVPTVEVTGGCFCCNYDDLRLRLDVLRDAARPDVVFAESVGSCADVVATVVKPLLELQSLGLAPASFSVFADIRLLRRRLLGLPLPFSDNVVYIFDKQLEEAGLIVANKADLVPDGDAREAERLARHRFPGKAVRLQISTDVRQVADWAQALQSGAIALPSKSLDIDYQRYGAGEAQLSWLDEEVAVTASELVGARAAAIALIEAIVAAIRRRGAPVGHLKFLVRGGQECPPAVAATEGGLSSPPFSGTKVSFITLAETGWQETIPALAGTRCAVVVNARVELEAVALRELVRDALARVAAATGATFDESEVAFFHPGFPTPTHRIQS